jgi:ornithine cyclodeaminase
MRAALETHGFEKVIGWNLHPEMLPNLEAVAQDAGVPFEAVELTGMVDADVIITITSSFAPSLFAEHVSPGTHIACMGTDTIGKQEVDAKLIAGATLFTDEVAQSVTLGETQHAIKAGLIKETDVNQIGSVINRTHSGRSSETEITIFDGTGVGLQDLAVASSIVDVAVSRGEATMVQL